MTPVSSEPKSEANASAPLERHQVLASFIARYPEVQYQFVQFLSEHMADCARSFGGDLEMPLILAVIGQSHIAAYMTQSAPAPERLNYGVSALRVADITGLPRETVRRKLKNLERLGWLRSTPKGWSLEGASAVDTAAGRDLEALNARGLERLSRLYTELSHTLAKPAGN